ncbi:Tetratricopeptide repeat [Phytophthora cactorum]|nr:Tetratricopeptide repeat [Phytophthora cactorum]
MAWGTSPPPAAPAAPAPMTANNAIFLILFGMFLMATLLPVLVATLFALLLSGCCSLNCSSYKPRSPVTSRERYAFGVLGRGAGLMSLETTLRLCVERHGSKALERRSHVRYRKYVVNGSGSDSASGSLRRRRVAESTGFQTGFNEVETESHRQIKAKALQCKVRKDWKNAAVFFLEAAKAASTVVIRASYELEAAWCTLEEVDTYPGEQSELVRKIRAVCDELASAGYFDEASRGLSELALRLKRRFPADCKTTALAKQVAELYVQAKNIAEAGGSVHSAAEYGLWAARVYADASLWSLAEGCFEAVGDIRRGNGQFDLANEAYGNAVLCRLGQLDIAGAEEMLNRFTEHMGETHRSSDMDFFLSSLLKACNKWSPQILETASKRYDSTHRLVPWQRKCLANLEEKMNNSDLRRNKSRVLAMDPELKRRTLLFDVRPAQQRPPLGVITQDYSEKLQRKHRRVRLQDEDGAEHDRGAEEDASSSDGPILPAGALPALFSPRPFMAPIKPPPTFQQASNELTANEAEVAPWEGEYASVAELPATPESSNYLFDEVQTFETEPEPAKPEPVDDTLATPIVLRKTGDKQPEVFTQHVLRGVILRKFLNVSTIAKKLRETEQHALGATALKPSGGGSFGKTPTTAASAVPRQSSLERVADSVNEDTSGGSSEGKQLTQPAQLPSSREKLKRRQSNMTDVAEDEASVISVRAKLDPTSAHILRICRHVIAKRAMKSFLRQEMSVITQTEVTLRDDAALQRRPNSSMNSRNGSNSRSTAIDNRTPIKAMASDLVESLAAYLKEGDQHMTVDELFLKALLSEAEKDWKRAILLASACVVIDREFILAALLRARCCRRLGLWTQAIKDLTHALQLRPEDQRLFLLRACLHSKMGDAENALADVNRALVLHPQYTEALLLRAEIFHRGRSVGAALQDLTSVLALDRSCWRAYYDRATLRLRAIEGDEQSLVYHSEHLRYEELLAAIIQDYVNALHKGCTLVEVVETAVEFTGDVTVLRQVIQNLTRLLHLLVLDPSAGLRAPRTPSNTSGLELLIAAIHTQRGRLYVLSNDKVSALEDFDHAVVMEYHYPVAHFYRGAFATLLLAKDSAAGISKDAETAAAHHANNMQHLSRCLALDPTIGGAPTLSEVWLQIALVYLNHYHDSEECIKACTSALANDAGLSRAIYLRAEAYTRQGNTAAALRDYTRLTRAQPSDRWAHLLRGRLQLTLKMARPALYSFVCFVEQVTNDPLTPADTKANKDSKPKKDALLLCGRAFQLLSRFQSAVRAFELAVAENPTSENLVLLSESLHSLGDTDNSLRVSEKVVNTDPSSFRGYARRAQLLVSVGQYTRAMAEYDRAISLAPKEGRVHYDAANVSVAICTTYPNARRGKNLGADAVKDEALVRKMMKQFFVSSIADLSKCIRLEPLLADAYVDRAELNALGEEYDRAFRDLETATERQPKFARAHVSLGVLKCQFAAYAAAIEDFDKTIKLETAATAEMRAFALLIAAALEDLEEVQQSAPDDDELHGALGFALLQLNRYEDAAKHFAAYGRLGRDTYVDSGNAYFNLATKNSESMSAAATLLAQMEPPAPKVHLTGSQEQMLALYMLNRGVMLEKMGNLPRARQDYEDSLHFDPLSVHAHVCLGTLSLRERNFEQSAAEFQRALELDPSSGVAHLNLGVVCLGRNDVPTALAHFDSAISLLPHCSYAYANKAVALARSGDMAGAELNFKLAINELPSRKEFYLARGKIVALQKRLHDAMVDFSTALFLGYDGKL